jgi:hypothetical protein
VRFFRLSVSLHFTGALKNVRPQRGGFAIDREREPVVTSVLRQSPADIAGIRQATSSYRLMHKFSRSRVRELSRTRFPTRACCGGISGIRTRVAAVGIMDLIAHCTRSLLRPAVRGIPAANNLESLECVYLCIQRTRSHPTVQGYGQAGKIPGSPVLSVILDAGWFRRRPPFAIVPTWTN